MRKLALSVLCGLLLCSGAALADGSIIVAEGPSAPNGYDESLLPDLFLDWCNDVYGPCFPTVELDVFDVRKGKRLGTIYAWGKDFQFGGDGTVQFKEFILYDLKDGQIFTISGDPDDQGDNAGHPGGNFVDPSLIPPKVPGNFVLVGGAEGQVVGGTGRYRSASGGYSTRLKVETPDFANFTYYDELYFRFRDVVINPGRND